MFLLNLEVVLLNIVLRFLLLFRNGCSRSDDFKFKFKLLVYFVKQSVSHILFCSFIRFEPSIRSACGSLCFAVTNFVQMLTTLLELFSNEISGEGVCNDWPCFIIWIFLACVLNFTGRNNLLLFQL